jgi:hypothetical protein
MLVVVVVEVVVVVVVVVVGGWWAGGQAGGWAGEWRHLLKVQLSRPFQSEDDLANGTADDGNDLIVFQGCRVSAVDANDTIKLKHSASDAILNGRVGHDLSDAHTTPHTPCR